MLKYPEFVEFIKKNFDTYDLEDFKKLKKENDYLKFIKNYNEISKTTKINIFNYEIFDIIKSLNLENERDKIIEKIKLINWKDFKELWKYKKKKPKIYQNFINFLKIELNLLTELHITNIYQKKEKFDIELKNQILAKKFNIEILFDYKKKGKKLSVTDFVIYFNRRYEYFYNLLKNRVDIENIISISKIKDLPNNDVVDIIGLVYSIRETKKGYIMEIEDKSGKINCFIKKDNKELMNIFKNITLDEGIAIKGRKGDNIIWVEEIVMPYPSNFYNNKSFDDEVYGLFISDTHFGAKLFKDESFQKLIDFIRGETENKELNEIAKKIRYIFIAGDVIEGIGIYPDQGKDVRIMSTEAQYNEAVRWLSQIPEDKVIIIIPGNHDTCRLTEPQLKMPYERAYALYNLPNTIILSNPSIVRILKTKNFEGYEIYIYHGGSLFYYGNEIPFLREKGGAKNPNEIVKYLLEKRHLAPSHGSTLYYPDTEEDPLVIKDLPDFFVLGHTHKLQVSAYKKTIVLSCGCWVDMSDYQEKMGMFPDPAKAILVNFKNKKIKVLNFETKKEEE